MGLPLLRSRVHKKRWVDRTEPRTLKSKEGRHSLRDPCFKRTFTPPDTDGRLWSDHLFLPSYSIFPRGGGGDSVVCGGVTRSQRRLWGSVASRPANMDTSPWNDVGAIEPFKLPRLGSPRSRRKTDLRKGRPVEEPYKPVPVREGSDQCRTDTPSRFKHVVSPRTLRIVPTPHYLLLHPRGVRRQGVECHGRIHTVGCHDGLGRVVGRGPT